MIITYFLFTLLRKEAFLINVAHYLTLLRIVLIPLFPVLYLEYNALNIPLQLLPYLLIFLLSICEFSDLFDGMLARKKNQVTDLGKVLDPMADSLMHITVFFTFTQGWVQLPLLLVFVFLYRELMVATLRTLCAIKGIVLAARTSGKIKTISQAVVSFFILFMMILYMKDIITLEALQKYSFTAALLAAIYSVFSIINYFIANKKLIRMALYKV